MKFNCSMCGECCRHISNIPELSDFNNGNGECIHLVNNKCDIYENRPEICNVDLMYHYFSNIYTLEEYYTANEEICKQLKENKN